MRRARRPSACRRGSRAVAACCRAEHARLRLLCQPRRASSRRTDASVTTASDARLVVARLGGAVRSAARASASPGRRAIPPHIAPRVVLSAEAPATASCAGGPARREHRRERAVVTARREPRQRRLDVGEERRDPRVLPVHRRAASPPAPDPAARRAACRRPTCPRFTPPHAAMYAFTSNCARSWSASPPPGSCRRAGRALGSRQATLRRRATRRHPSLRLGHRRRLARAERQSPAPPHTMRESHRRQRIAHPPRPRPTRSCVSDGAESRGRSFSVRRTGSTTIGMPACWSRRWMRNAVSLWSTRFHVESSSKRSWPATKSPFGILRRSASCPIFSASTGDLHPRREARCSAGEPERRREAHVLVELAARPLLELVHLVDPLEVARVDDGDRAEDDPLEVAAGTCGAGS